MLYDLTRSEKRVKGWPDACGAMMRRQHDGAVATPQDLDRLTALLGRPRAAFATLPTSAQGSAAGVRLRAPEGQSAPDADHVVSDPRTTRTPRTTTSCSTRTSAPVTAASTRTSRCPRSIRSSTPSTTGWWATSRRPDDDTSADRHRRARRVELPTAQSPDGWNGERLFQAARFVTEMEYQHLVFEEFARKVQPAIRPFHVYHAGHQPGDPGRVRARRLPLRALDARRPRGAPERRRRREPDRQLAAAAQRRS